MKDKGKGKKTRRKINQEERKQKKEGGKGPHLQTESERRIL